MIGGHGCLEHFVRPVRIGIKQRIAAFVISPGINGFLVELGIFSSTGITMSLVSQFHVIGIVGYSLHCLSDGFQRDVTSIIYGNLTLLTLLGSNQDYTVGSTATVNGSRSGVFQHGHALHVLRRHGIDVTLHTVDDDERGRVVQRALSAH